MFLIDIIINYKVKKYVVFISKYIYIYIYLKLLIKL